MTKLMSLLLFTCLSASAMVKPNVRVLQVRDSISTTIAGYTITITSDSNKPGVGIIATTMQVLAAKYIWKWKQPEPIFPKINTISETRK